MGGLGLYALFVWVSGFLPKEGEERSWGLGPGVSSGRTSSAHFLCDFVEIILQSPVLSKELSSPKISVYIPALAFPMSLMEKTGYTELQL